MAIAPKRAAAELKGLLRREKARSSQLEIFASTLPLFSTSIEVYIEMYIDVYIGVYIEIYIEMYIEM